MRQSYLPFGGQASASSSSSSSATMAAVTEPTSASKARPRPQKATSKSHLQPRLYPTAGPSSHTDIEEPTAKRARTNGHDGKGPGTNKSTPSARAAPVAIPDSARLWTDVMRPQCAEDVIGNDAHAMYLRDWLRALQVVAKRPPSGTASTDSKAAKGKKPENDIYSIGRTAEEEAWFDQFRQSETAALGSTLGNGASAGTAISVDDASREVPLSNAIVLTGPSGCGKTAAVYACAAELGFEVFELYPGMGRRAGKDIQNAVGDLGRNHMVSSGGTGGGAFRAAASAGAARPVTSFFQSKGQAAGSSPGKQKSQPRQSLILLEEVDVLYADDKGFWPAVIELIGDSRRPIVMTCQDLSSIPLQDLYVQRVIEFLPPSAELVAPYLAFLAEERGQMIDEQELRRLYSHTRGRAETTTQQRQLHLPNSGPLHPATAIGICSDLRQTVLQHQFAHQRASKSDSNGVLPSRKMGVPDGGLGLRALIAQAERRSFADAHLRMPFERAVELLEPDQYMPSPDDLQNAANTTALLKLPPRSDAVALPMYGREEELQEALCGPDILDNVVSDAAYDGIRVGFCRLMEQYLEGLSVPLTSLLPASDAVLDYAALVRNMVGADDAEEAAHEARIQAAVYEAQGLDGDAHNQGEEGYDIKATDAYQRASASLSKLGIRPSRQSTKMLLQRGSDGLLELSRREADFCRWLILSPDTLDCVRRSVFDMSAFP